MLEILPAASVRAQRSTPAVSRVEPSPTDGKYKLYPTQNIWTFLLLDSSTGRVWQIAYSLADSVFAGRLSLNETALVASTGAHVGRFLLRETQNIYTFLLLDQDDGRVWQLQWANEERNRGIVRPLAAALP